MSVLQTFLIHKFMKRVPNIFEIIVVLCITSN